MHGFWGAQIFLKAEIHSVPVQLSIQEDIVVT